jgi:5-methylcytosine-specific restriction endonuclease McrBC regulatory subunit McrC
MDKGDGNFLQIDNREELKKFAEAERKSMQELAKRLFQVDEEIQIKDSRFKIKKITKKGMNLKLLPKVKG